MKETDLINKIPLMRWVNFTAHFQGEIKFFLDNLNFPSKREIQYYKNNVFEKERQRDQSEFNFHKAWFYFNSNPDAKEYKNDRDEVITRPILNIMSFYFLTEGAKVQAQKDVYYVMPYLLIWSKFEVLWKEFVRFYICSTDIEIKSLLLEFKTKIEVRDSKFEKYLSKKLEALKNNIFMGPFKKRVANFERLFQEDLKFQKADKFLLDNIELLGLVRNTHAHDGGYISKYTYQKFKEKDRFLNNDVTKILASERINSYLSISRLNNYTDNMGFTSLFEYVNNILIQFSSILSNYCNVELGVNDHYNNQYK